VSAPTGRRRHYAEFYGDAPLPDDGRPLAWVHGNCQAESLRMQLEAPDLATVRVPPVHELIENDLPHLDRLCRRTDVFVSQPVHEDYRDLPLGLGQLAAAMPTARVARVPVVRFAGLFPTHVIVRPPSDRSLAPPLVAYHDIGTLWEAGTGARDAVSLTPDRVRAVAAQSVHELWVREEHHDTITVSDLFGRPRFPQMRTLNHPGNEVVEAMAGRVRDRLGLDPTVTPLPRPLLDGVHAPRAAVVAEAFDLDPSDVRREWRVDGSAVPVETVRERHLAWYAEHPDAVTAGLERHAALLPLLGLVA
jgi:hypothetical protein